MSRHDRRGVIAVVVIVTARSSSLAACRSPKL
jgi:hypothetical protein